MFKKNQNAIRVFLIMGIVLSLLFSAGCTREKKETGDVTINEVKPADEVGKVQAPAENEKSAPGAGGKKGEEAGASDKRVKDKETKTTNQELPGDGNKNYNVTSPLNGSKPLTAGNVRRAPQESDLAGKMPGKPAPGKSVPNQSIGNQPVPNEPVSREPLTKNYGINPFVETAKDHLSTFAVDVDSASYTQARNYLKVQQLPAQNLVRVEEFVNFFDYGYKAPRQNAFNIYLEGAPSPYSKDSLLLKVALKGKQVKKENRKKANLTFVIDVSGSMNRYNRLPLVKESLKMLTNELSQGDRIGIVIYGSDARVVLDHTGIDQKEQIIRAIDSLQNSGSTYAEAGLRKGYELANKNYQGNAINRIILCSDGVANVGRTRAEELLQIIEKYKEDGIYLSTIGYGMGEYSDVLMETLGDKGNGHYVYVDDIKEAERLFRQDLTSTLQVIGRDTKVQVDFNPGVVKSYRLLGYENRDVADHKFRDDREDGGEVGAGHTVTALYEVKLNEGRTGKVATVFVRYMDPDSGQVKELNASVNTSEFRKSFAETSTSFKLAASAAQFAEILRESNWAKGESLSQVLSVLEDLPQNVKSSEKVNELIGLVRIAHKIKTK